MRIGLLLPACLHILAGLLHWWSLIWIVRFNGCLIPRLFFSFQMFFKTLIDQLVKFSATSIEGDYFLVIKVCMGGLQAENVNFACIIVLYIGAVEKGISQLPSQTKETLQVSVEMGIEAYSQIGPVNL